MADYTLDQLRSLWEEGSKAGDFAPAEYQTRQSPEGEGGGGQTYEAYGVSPNSILLQNGDPRYSMPTLTKLSDEEGGGFRSVTDMLGGAEHVTYSPEGKVIDRKFYENPKPSHQDFLKLAGGLAAGVGGLSALAGAGAAGAAGAGGFGITPEMAASLFSGAAPEAVGTGVASLGGELAGPLIDATIPASYGSVVPGAAAGAIGSALGGAGAAGAAGAGGFGITPEAIASLYGAEAAGGAAATGAGTGGIASLGGGELAGPLIDATIPASYGTTVPGAAATGAAGATGAGGSLLGDAAKAGVSKLLSDPRLLTSLAAGVGAGALTAHENKKKIGPVGYQGKIDPNRLKYNRDTGEYTVRATGEKYAAGGGIAGLKPNEYKAGGRYLSGPGDGMSDNIKANIDGQQEARLADGEFVIPADVVSHIGNGSSNAGAKKLHAMMNRIRRARTGNPKQGKQIKPEKYLPA
jgi:hypothetical protein